MKKKALIIMTTVILTLGAVTAVYARGNNNSNNFGFNGAMMNQNNVNNGTYNKMIGIMQNSGFEAGAKAMESRDLNAMSSFMNNLTDNQYNQMINIMQNNGYAGMAKIMGSVNRQGMANIHNSMMGR